MAETAPFCSSMAEIEVVAMTRGYPRSAPCDERYPTEPPIHIPVVTVLDVPDDQS